MKRLACYFSVFVAVMIFSGCAQIVPLSGGERDTTPPKLQSAEPLNYSTGFSSRKIVLQFDEFVQVRDLQNQLVVSPRLKTDPLVSAEGKKILVELDPADLAPNTTYRFAFGKAIADMHESNPAENFEFVFSTGKQIDTLRISGSATDVLSQRPQKGISVCLYRKPGSDSLPYKEIPDYTARTDDGGRFYFKNLPETTFEVIAFSDNNKNNVYDGETEKAGFRTEKLQLKKDTTVNVLIFQEEPSKTFIKKTITPFYGLAQILLNRKTNVKVSALNFADRKNVSEVRQGDVKDTVHLFYRTITDSLKLIVNADGMNKADTLNLVLPRNNRTKRVMGNYQLNLSSGKIQYNKNLLLKFNVWMDTNRFDDRRAILSFVKDSVRIQDTLKGKWTDVSTFEVRNKLIEGMDYTLRTDTGVFFDVFGSTSDSAKNVFKVQSKTELGKATLKLSLLKKGSHLIQLISEDLRTIRQQSLSLSLSASNTATLDFNDLTPGTYQVRIISDLNQNGKWDTGNMLKRIQPEPAEINPKLLKVLSDWEIEEDIIQRASEPPDKK